MRKICMLPTVSTARADLSNSINQIVTRLEKTLPEYGYELTENEQQADLIVGHAGQSGGRGLVDVAHCHGLYWTAYGLNDNWHWGANAAVIRNLRGAKQTTVPSEWVAQAIRRDMGFSPHVVGWGIDFDEWQPAENQGYVLWAKTRVDGVCSPDTMLKLASMCHNQLFLTTFGTGTPNVKAIGRQPFHIMREHIRHAGVYLADVLETFGLMTLECMAAGIPILGYDYGGTGDLVKHGVNGYLVQPGDFEGLKEGLEYCLAHRETLGANGREMAKAYTWSRVAQQFANVYDMALEPHKGARCTVVLPVYNYARYLPEALRSVAAQQTSFPFEIIVVDDGSADDPETAFSTTVDEYDLKAQNPNITRLEFYRKENGGVASARNYGITRGTGEFIMCLDADDRLGHPHMLQTLADNLASSPLLGIVYTGLRVMNEKSELSPQPSNWPNGFDFELQISGRNQVPTCCLFRKEAWRRAGGYHWAVQPSEDANLWTRIAALGYDALQVVQDGWFLYRMHSNSLSSPIREGKASEPNWRNFAWVQDGKRPFASLGRAPAGSYPVRHYHRPVVSVIIPVGKGHEGVLQRALDSMEAQTIREWECIVVNDTGGELALLPAWVKEIKGKQKNAAAARNAGIAAATAPLIAFLDADDFYLPTFLEDTLRAYKRTGRYVYTDWHAINKEGKNETHETLEFERGGIFREMQTFFHSINVLMRREDAVAVGGFDESMSTWEDVDFFMKLQAAGHCAVRVPKPLVVYDYRTGKLREQGLPQTKQLKDLLYNRYKAYQEKPELCACNEVKGTAGVLPTPANLIANGDMDAEKFVRAEYIGGGKAGHNVIGANTAIQYGYRQRGDIFLVHVDDLTNKEQFVAVAAELPQLTPKTVAPPAPVRIGA